MKKIVFLMFCIILCSSLPARRAHRDHMRSINFETWNALTTQEEQEEERQRADEQEEEEEEGSEKEEK